MLGNRHPLRLLWHCSKAVCALLLYLFPARKLTVIGITGTDGKTTTVGMVAHILTECGYTVGALSTAYVRIADTQQWNETQKTSPSPFVIQRFLRNCVRSGCTHVVLECSSHGLVQKRLLGIFPHVAAITNTSAEHLDYHGTLEQYRADKAILFRMLRGRGVKVLNADDATVKLYSEIPSSSTVTYSATKGDATLTVQNVSVDAKRSHATVSDTEHGTSSEMTLHVPGAFNIENALCTLGAVRKYCSLSDACNALSSFRGAPGRMEAIDEGQNFAVFVDFTVTPAAYTKTLSTLRAMIGDDRRILVLTGSCGDRMKEKRPIVGKICSEMADIVVVTNEDPYTEDPQKIIDDVWAGVDQSQCEAKQIFDRREAMEWLISQAKEGDAVILCAKGSDTTMWTAQGQVPWNEREIAREILQKLKMEN